MLYLALRIARALPDITVGTLIVIVHATLRELDARTRTPATRP